MNPQRRQIRLQCEAITSAPHISQRGAPVPSFAFTFIGTSGTGGKTRPSGLESIELVTLLRRNPITNPSNAR